MPTRSALERARSALHLRLLAAQRRHAQLQGELTTERARWATLKASAQDADRMGHGIDVPSFMRGLEADLPVVPAPLADRLSEVLSPRELRPWDAERDS
jgi:hypothetical protein